MAKKNKVAKNQSKKKSDNDKKINPFEVYHKKKKHSVLGVKEKRISGMPGVSRSRATAKRNQTLGVEYKKRHKKNAFVDERFGADDAMMSAEDKMMARFAVERQKHHSKQRFNLEEDVLTHKGQRVDQIEEFDDVYSSGDEAEPPDTTTDMHFGGFLTKNEGGTAKHLSGKDVMDEIVAKSKLQKMERQKQREETTEETAQLDKDWTAVHGILIHKLKPVATAKKDDYDKAVSSLIFEAKAKPTNRLKTDEELAKERRDLLEKMEAQRLQRMKKGPEETSEHSADALLSRKVRQKSEKVLVSYDKEGKMNSNDEFDKALDSLKNKNKEEDESDDEEEASGDEETDEEDDEEEGEESDEEEEEEEAGSEEEENEEEEESDDNAEQAEEDTSGKEVDLPLVPDDIEDGDGNCVIEDIVAEEDEEEPLTDHQDLAQDISADIPFVIEAPEHLSELNALVAGQSDENVETIIKRIVASNHPTLKEENKTKTATFYVVLIKYLVSKYGEGTLSRTVLDESCKALFSVTKHVQRDVYKHFFDVLNSLKHLVAKNTGKSLSAVISKRYVIYLYVLQRIYPVTDYKHPVITPILMSINWALAACSVKKLSDLKVGVFLCNFVLQCTKGRYCPEVVYFLTQVFRCLATTTSSKSQEYVSNFKVRADSLEDSSKPGKLSISQLYDNQTSKSDVFYALLLTARTALRNSHDFTGFSGIFYSLVEALKQVQTEKWHADIQSLVTSLSTLYCQYSQKIMPFLRYQNVKPVSIKMYEPKFGEVFVRERKNKDETKYLKKKIKTEMKGAIREIRKDNKFISRVKHKEQEGMDKARKRKVNEIMGFLSKEQGEANDLKYRKKRGQI